VNVAVAEVLAVSERVHEPVPEQAPDHPANVDPDAGVAVSVTGVPLSKFAVQVAPQLIPDGVLVTVPEPVPLTWTLSWREVGVGEEPMVPPPQPTVRKKEVKQPQLRSIRRMGTLPASILLLKRVLASVVLMKGGNSGLFRRAKRNRKRPGVTGEGRVGELGSKLEVGCGPISSLSLSEHGNLPCVLSCGLAAAVGASNHC
jgi:hypothetical protein